MKYIINKIVDGEIEYLPTIGDTPLAECIEGEFTSRKISKTEHKLAALYFFLYDREMFYQENVPTAFGSPEYSMRSGLVAGFCSAMEWDEISNDGYIIIKDKRGKTLLQVEKLIRPKDYHEKLKEISTMWDRIYD